MINHHKNCDWEWYKLWVGRKIEEIVKSYVKFLRIAELKIANEHAFIEIM